MRVRDRLSALSQDFRNQTDFSIELLPTLRGLFANPRAAFFSSYSILERRLSRRFSQSSSCFKVVGWLPCCAGRRLQKNGWLH
jgi:hypothetical protein